MEAAFQDQMKDNGCFGCGPGNDLGLKLKSRWQGDQAVATFQPEPHMTAGPPQYLNGGIIATVIDCHCVCTALADAYRRAGRAVGTGEPLWYVTGKLEVSFKKPVAIDQPVLLKAWVVEHSERKSRLRCELSSAGALCAEAELTAISVDPNWVQGTR